MNVAPLRARDVCPDMGGRTEKKRPKLMGSGSPVTPSLMAETPEETHRQLIADLATQTWIQSLDAHAVFHNLVSSMKTRGNKPKYQRTYNVGDVVSFGTIAIPNEQLTLTIDWINSREHRQDIELKLMYNKACVRVSIVSLDSVRSYCDY